MGAAETSLVGPGAGIEQRQRQRGLTEPEQVSKESARRTNASRPSVEGLHHVRDRNNGTR